MRGVAVWTNQSEHTKIIVTAGDTRGDFLRQRGRRSPRLRRRSMFLVCLGRDVTDEAFERRRRKAAPERITQYKSAWSRRSLSSARVTTKPSLSFPLHSRRLLKFNVSEGWGGLLLAAAHLYKHFTSSLNVKSLADLHVLTTCGAGKLQLKTFF